jgi:predicted small secreted protein
MKSKTGYSQARRQYTLPIVRHRYAHAVLDNPCRLLSAPTPGLPIPTASTISHHTYEKENAMRRNLSLVLTLLALLGLAPVLAACHTTAGVGRDISATGGAITNDAVKSTP